MKRRFATASLVLGALAGCASYQPKPLPQDAHSHASVAQLDGASTTGEVLDLPTLQRLVLLNNPQLATARAQHQLAQAQMLQAGLLPNPAFSGSVGFLISGPGDATAWTAALTEDITGLLTLKPRREAARADAQAIDAQLLWQEWQTLTQAELLLVDLVQGRRLSALQQNDLALLQQRRQRELTAIGQGLLERADTASDIAAAQDAQAAQDDLAQHLLDLHQQLCAMLGLQPGAALRLPQRITLPTLDLATVAQASRSMAGRNPDLVALQLGYQAQDANLRAQVLAQFPGLSFGYASASDNSHVYNGGPAVSFQLPLFDRNQHGIAAAAASRDQLWLTYRHRLAQAHDEIQALSDQYRLGQLQRDALQAALQQDTTRMQADHARQAGDLDVRRYTDLSHDAALRQSRLIALEQAQMEREIALQALIGQGLPQALPATVVQP